MRFGTLHPKNLPGCQTICVYQLDFILEKCYISLMKGKAKKYEGGPMILKI